MDLCYTSGDLISNKIWEFGIVQYSTENDRQQCCRVCNKYYRHCT